MASVLLRVVETTVYERDFELEELAEESGLSEADVAALDNDALLELVWQSTCLTDRLYRHGDIDDSRAQVVHPT